MESLVTLVELFFSQNETTQTHANKQYIVQHHPYHRIFFPQVNANQPCASNIMRNMATAQTWLSNNRCDLS